MAAPTTDDILAKMDDQYRQLVEIRESYNGHMTAMHRELETDSETLRASLNKLRLEVAESESRLTRLEQHIETRENGA